LRFPRVWSHRARTKAQYSPTLDDELDIFGEVSRDFGDDVPFLEANQMLPPMGAEHEDIHTACGGKVHGEERRELSRNKRQTNVVSPVGASIAIQQSRRPRPANVPRPIRRSQPFNPRIRLRETKRARLCLQA
jgi:hypothetical protein